MCGLLEVQLLLGTQTVRFAKAYFLNWLHANLNSTALVLSAISEAGLESSALVCRSTSPAEESLCILNCSELFNVAEVPEQMYCVKTSMSRGWIHQGSGSRPEYSTLRFSIHVVKCFDFLFIYIITFHFLNGYHDNPSQSLWYS